MRPVDLHIKTLEKYLQAFPYQFKNIPFAELSLKPNPIKWSIKEILGHLIDSATYNLERFTKIRFAPKPFEIIPYQQAELVKANNYQNADPDHLQTLWKALNQQILNIWKTYSEEELEYKISIPNLDKEVTLAWWINDYTEHLEHHLKQIFRSLEVFETQDWQVTLESAKKALSKEQEKRFVTLLEYGSMYVEYYKPVGKDLQSPHRQDELYVVASGSGTFFNNGKRHPFKSGDVLFVPAGVEHRFEDFSEDFATWVIFYGPDGGEKPKAF